jgi:hypothetical protein
MVKYHDVVLKKPDPGSEIRFEPMTLTQTGGRLTSRINGRKWPWRERHFET